MRLFDVSTSVLATIARFGYAERVEKPGARPAKTLELFEFEACPYCRKVREAFTVLDLDAVIRPSPKGGHRFRDEVIRRGGKAQFPYLVDRNTDIEMYESDDINRYLFSRYGKDGVPWQLSNAIALPSGMGASALRGGRGSRQRKSRAPEKMIELYSYEGSPFCRLVRETLCEMEIPYLLHNVAKGSAKRETFMKLSGKMQVPYLVDPNTGAGLFESAEIIGYLERTYAD